MSEVGAIRMRTPKGNSSRIAVSKGANGKIDIHFERSREGELLVRLTREHAMELARLINAATE